MSDAAEVRALIAEAQQLLRAYAGTLALARGGDDFGAERAWKVADALEAAHAEQDDDEREALMRVLDDSDPEGGTFDDRYIEPLGFWGPQADAVLASGFRRSARVPVSRDELTETLFELRYPDGFWSGGTHEPREAGDEEVAGSLLATHDIYPKADRKPAPVAPVDERHPPCVERWPGCSSGDYDPRCCRFPKSCSAGVIRISADSGETER